MILYFIHLTILRLIKQSVTETLHFDFTDEGEVDSFLGIKIDTADEKYHHNVITIIDWHKYKNIKFRKSF